MTYELYDIKNKIVLAEDENLGTIYIIKARCFKHNKTVIRVQKKCPNFLGQSVGSK